MPSAYDPWGPLPSPAECERALRFLGWAYESCFVTAEELYRREYGDLPCFAVDAPDGGHLGAMHFLKRAVSLLEVQREVRQSGQAR
ncbi:hypothetical protein SEA_DUNCANSLEG_103 [Mycobacterium phage DuncansLeg]|nr:hypothetical protein SEA_DUNCANSLEG_103 [Mycobacterium phage DuncansLeg]